MPTWTVCHPIDEASPLVGATTESLAASSAAIIVTLKGIEDTLGDYEVGV